MNCICGNTPTGHRITMDTPIVNKAGNTACLAGFFQDKTDKKQHFLGINRIIQFNALESACVSCPWCSREVLQAFLAVIASYFPMFLHFFGSLSFLTFPDTKYPPTVKELILLETHWYALCPKWEPFYLPQMSIRVPVSYCFNW